MLPAVELLCIVLCTREPPRDRIQEGRIRGLQQRKEDSVPSFVPSGRLDTFGSKLGRSIETRIFTGKSEHIQIALKC
jgi:hypothetical protein